MTVTQTVEIPASRRITLEVPIEIPAGKTKLVIQFHAQGETQAAVPQEDMGQIGSEAFRQVLRRAHGAWKGKPWKNHLDDVSTMRDEWEERH